MKLYSLDNKNYIREDKAFDIQKIESQWYLRANPTDFPTVIASFEKLTHALDALVLVSPDLTKVGA